MGERLEGTDPARAEAFFLAALLEGDETGISAYRLGKLLLSQRKFEGAIHALRRALRATPDHGDTRHQLAKALHLSGRHGAALTHANKLLAATPTHPAACRLKRDLLIALGRRRAALRHADKFQSILVSKQDHQILVELQAEFA